MKLVLSALFLISSAVVASATPVATPEIDTLAGLSALGLVGAVATLIWERARR